MTGGFFTQLGPPERRALLDVDRQKIGFGEFSGTTHVTSSSLVVPHGLSWTPKAVVVQPATPNGATADDRFTSANVTAITSTTFTIGRCISHNASLLADTFVTGYWAAFA